MSNGHTKLRQVLSQMYVNYINNWVFRALSYCNPSNSNFLLLPLELHIRVSNASSIAISYRYCNLHCSDV